jgi:3-hydroxyacyl-[acyl-carrier-protein] dehydratase
LDAVTKYIPHREPFLFVDEIVEMTDERIVTKKRLSGTEPFFEGHYPNSPIMPGVLLLEAIFQSGAILISKLMSEKEGSDTLNGVPVLTRIQNAKFKKMVKPGDVVDIKSSIKETLANVYYMKGTASVDGKKSVVVEYACCLAKETYG